MIEGRRSYQYSHWACTCKNIASVSESVREYPTTSTRCRLQQLQTTNQRWNWSRQTSNSGVPCLVDGLKWKLIFHQIALFLWASGVIRPFFFKISRTMLLPPTANIISSNWATAHISHQTIAFMAERQCIKNTITPH